MCEEKREIIMEEMVLIRFWIILSLKFSNDSVISSCVCRYRNVMFPVNKRIDFNAI
jgi:hypothetical protein